MPKQPLLPAGYEGPGPCEPYDLPAVLDLANLVLRTLNVPAGAPGRAPSIGSDYAHVYNPGNLDNIRVVRFNGRVVSSVAIYPTEVKTPLGTLRVGGINAFVTHPNHRRRGIGEAVLLDSHARMVGDGCHVALLGTRIQDYYRKYGWESAGQQRGFMFDRGNVALLPDASAYDVSSDWLPIREQVHALYAAKHQGAIRSLDRFTYLARRKFGQVMVARRSKRVVAYAGVSETSVREYGGAPADVLALLRRVFAEVDDPSVRTSERPPGRRATVEMIVTTPAAADAVADRLLNLGIPSSLEYMGMLLVLDGPGLFEALGIRVAAEMTDDAGWILTSDAGRAALSEHEFVKLVFGPERIVDFGRRVFPIPFYQWPADRV